MQKTPFHSFLSFWHQNLVNMQKHHRERFILLFGERKHPNVGQNIQQYTKNLRKTPCVCKLVFSLFDLVEK